MTESPIQKAPLVLLFRCFSDLARLLFGQKIAAVMGLTWKAAFRFRLFIVIAVLLLAAVVGLPILIKDDGTARGFTQILLTYTLSTITALLGLSTLWLACGTLARDVEECQIQVLATKPIARWQIWLGKWLGIVSLNAALLAIAGGSVYALLLYRATKLPEKEQTILRNEVLVARGAAREANVDKQLDEATEHFFKEYLARARAEDMAISALDVSLIRQQIREGLIANVQTIPPGGMRLWEIDLGLAGNYLRDRPLFLRVKFNAAEKSPTGTFDAVFMVGEPETPQATRLGPFSLAPDTFHELEVPPNLLDERRVLTVVFLNPNNTSLVFPLGEDMEVLYREGGFGLNFARGLGIVFCWMALLATIGLSAASFLSFPVAAFASLAALVMAFSTGTLASAIETGTVMGQDEETGHVGSSPVDAVVIPLFRGSLAVINLAKDFSPIDSLSTGRSITWSQLGRAAGQIVLLLGGVIGVFGIWTFNRRELATAQGTQ